MRLKEKLNLDVFRLIASFMVVAIHVYPFVSLNENIDYIFTRVIFRIAVPLFLMITGYYVISKSINDIDVLKRFTLKTIKLYLISILIFLPLNLYNHYFLDNSVVMILKDIVINGTFYHLWYFPALILGLWITYFLIKYLKQGFCISIILILYIIGLFGDTYYGIVSNIPILKQFYQFIFMISDYTRNGLFYVPMFLYIGYMSKNCENKLSYERNIIYIIIFLLLMIIEGYLLYYFNIPRHSSMYVFLLPLSYFIFNLLIFNYKGQNKMVRDYATWIYILHPFFIVVVRVISKLIHLNILIDNSFIYYIYVLLLTIFFIFVITKVKEVLYEARITKK